MSGPFSDTKASYAFKVSNPDTGAGSNCRVYYRTSTWWRSGTVKKHRYTRPLPYSMRVGFVSGTYGRNQSCDAANQLGLSTLSDSRWNDLANSISNRALSKFISEAQGSASASLGETLAEWKQSRDMIAARALQLAQIASAIRRRDPKGLGRALGGGISRRQKRIVRDKAKSFGDKWLEFHFGWEPLIGDIYAACDVIDRDPFPRLCEGNASASDRYETLAVFPGTSKSLKQAGLRIGYAVRAKVHVVNPNAALFAQLGLVNPAAVAWALVPYSFFVDWIWDIQGYLEGLDGLLGCETLDASYTTLRTGNGVELSHVWQSGAWTLNKGVMSSGASCTRIVGLPPYHFTYPHAPRFSWQRAVTTMALFTHLL